MTIRDFTMLSGLFFTNQDVEAAAKVAVMGAAARCPPPVSFLSRPDTVTWPHVVRS